eukprot:CAMPEP_0170133368 /NCGR_PEP_ID=MMETSP0033_2-20121228/1254_1 /TAXON_ID=195969 /ORGANISM="Dolichomastix tenuilepis, Strain CCMP3274" /LENGTH=382 /DNA_ID=CAMNT_0010368847 /DNA_START=63 /DNA_END=1211 /DNA_ORIENTATION=-
MRFYNVPLGLIWGKSSGPYKKLPVLKVGDRQINDSHVIVKSLAPALIGRALSAAEVECERDTLTHGMQLTFEAEALATAEDLRKLSSNVDVWGVPTLTSIFADLISPVMSRGWARRHPNLEPAVHSARAFKRAFPADTLFYHGAAPGLLDVAAYGTLLLFVEPGMGFARRALAEAGLEAWYAKMRARLPPESSSDVAPIAKDDFLSRTHAHDVHVAPRPPQLSQLLPNQVQPGCKINADVCALFSSSLAAADVKFNPGVLQPLHHKSVLPIRNVAHVDPFLGSNGAARCSFFASAAMPRVCGRPHTTVTLKAPSTTGSWLKVLKSVKVSALMASAGGATESTVAASAAAGARSLGPSRRELERWDCAGATEARVHNDLIIST